MKKCLSFRTKVEAVVVLLLLVGITASAVTVKWGTDDSGQSWAGITDGLITNSNGKAWTATGANLQLAIEDLNATGGTIYLPIENITLTNGFLLKPNINLIGQGSNNTILDGTGITGYIFDITAPAEHIEQGTIIKNIKFYGTDGVKGIRVQSGTYLHKRVRIEQCQFLNLETSIKLSRSYNSQITQCKFNTNVASQDYHIYMGGCNGATISNCNVVSESGYGLYNVAETDGSEIRVENCWFENGVGEATHIYADQSTSISNTHLSVTNGKPCIETGSNCGHLAIDNCNIRGSANATNYCLDLSSCQKITITNTRINSNGMKRAVYGNDDLLISNSFLQASTDSDYVVYANGYCEMSNNYITNTVGKGIYVGNESVINGNYFKESNTPVYIPQQGAIVSNNVFDMCTGAYSVAVASHRNTISNNNFKFSQADGVWLVGDYNLIEGNTFWDCDPGIDINSNANNNSIVNNIAYDGVCINDDGDDTNLKLGNIGSMAILPNTNFTTSIEAGYAWYDTTNHRITVYEGSGVWKHFDADN